MSINSELDRIASDVVLQVYDEIAKITDRELEYSDIDLDGDDDTSIRASADDIITFEAGAVDIAQMTSTMAISGSSVSTGSFGRVEATTLKGDGSELTNVTDDTALAFSIVFGG